MAVLEINDENFNEVMMASGKTGLVDFYAVWCGPCKMMAPVVEEIAAEHPEYAVGKCDVDTAPALAAQFGIMSIPTLLIIKDGAVAETFVGVTAKEALLAALG